jgi:hypothetical protein
MMWLEWLYRWIGFVALKIALATDTMSGWMAGLARPARLFA